MNVTEHPDFIKCVYRGRTYMHYIPSTTGIISTFNLFNYGYGKDGDIIYVHKQDVQKSPHTYQTIENVKTITGAKKPVKNK